MTGKGGFLTEGQREYLEEDHSPPWSSAETTKRKRIRSRTKDALEDLALVGENMHLSDIEQLFYKPNTILHRTDLEALLEEHDSKPSRTPTPAGETPPLNLVAPIVSLLYLGSTATEKQPGEANPFADDPDFFRSQIERGIHKAHRRRSEIVENSNVTIEIEKKGADELDLNKLGDLSYAELGLLLDEKKRSREMSFLNHLMLVKMRMSMTCLIPFSLNFLPTKIVSE